MKHKCLVYLSARKHFLFQVKIKRYDQFVVKTIQKKSSKFSSKCLYLKKFVLRQKIFFYRNVCKTFTNKIKKTVGQKNLAPKRYDHREVVARPKIIRGDQADFFKKMKKKFFSWKLLIDEK